MTLPSTINKVQYDGDGATVAFPVTFIYWDDTDILVTHRDSSGVETVWVDGTQYNLAGGDGETGTLTVDTSPTDYTPLNNETLTIESNRANTQALSLPGGGALPSAAIEQALDQIVRMVQQIEAAADRRLHYPTTDASNLSSEIPNSSDRASKFLAFNSSGEPLASTGPTGDSSIPVSSYIETLLDDATAAVARATLGAQQDVVTTRGDIIRGSSTGVAERLALGSTGEALISNGLDLVFAALPIPLGVVNGLTCSKSAADVLAIAAGSARDAGDAANMVLASFTKDVSSTWAVGTGNGSLDTGSYAGTTVYAVWLIRRSDTGVVDILTSESFTAPTMPASGAYDQKRLIGFFVTDSGPDIIAFTQVGDYFRFIGDIITDVVDASITGATYETGTLSLPPSSLAHLYGTIDNNTASGSEALVIRTPGSAEGDPVAAEETWFYVRSGAAFDTATHIGMVLTDASSQIEYTADEASGSATVTISTIGCFMLTRSTPI